MENVPVKKGLEILLEQELKYEDLPCKGIYNVKTKNMYLKLTSKMSHSPLAIDKTWYKNPQEAINDTIICAKVYKKFIDGGLYHPETQIVVYQDEREILGFLVLMPRLENMETYCGDIKELIRKKLEFFSKKFNLSSMTSFSSDPEHDFNWGYDNSTKEIYLHDLHVTCHFKETLRLAKTMGIN